MKTISSYKDLSNGEWNVVFASSFEALTTGVCAAGQHPDGSIVLRYTDFSESTPVVWTNTNIPELEAFSNWFELIGIIQDQQRKII